MYTVHWTEYDTESRKSYLQVLTILLHIRLLFTQGNIGPSRPGMKFQRCHPNFKVYYFILTNEIFKIIDSLKKTIIGVYGSFHTKCTLKIFSLQFEFQKAFIHKNRPKIMAFRAITSRVIYAKNAEIHIS